MWGWAESPIRSKNWLLLQLPCRSDPKTNVRSLSTHRSTNLENLVKIVQVNSEKIGLQETSNTTYSPTPGKQAGLAYLLMFYLFHVFRLFATHLRPIRTTDAVLVLVLGGLLKLCANLLCFYGNTVSSLQKCFDICNDAKALLGLLEAL